MGQQDRTLRRINRMRMLGGGEPLVRLPRAVPGDSSYCVYAQGLKDIDPNVWTTGYFTSYRPRRWLPRLYMPTLTWLPFIVRFDRECFPELVADRVACEDPRTLVKRKLTVTKANRVMTRAERKEMRRLTAEAEREISAERIDAARLARWRAETMPLYYRMLSEMWADLGTPDDDLPERRSCEVPRRQRGAHVLRERVR